MSVKTFKVPKIGKVIYPKTAKKESTVPPKVWVNFEVQEKIDKAPVKEVPVETYKK